ncbi:MAG TPA: ABATE domain-containing protein [Stellaceae bacterium]|nr:ABATE domain-containing protein [Stellaceae bacterium]
MTTRAPAGPASECIGAPRDDLCLDFMNTRYWRGSEPPTETLGSLDALLEWAAQSSGIEPAAIKRIGRRWHEDGHAGDAAFDEAIRLREVMYRVFGAVAGAKKPAPADIGALNAALAEAPPRTRLVQNDAGFVWQVDRLAPSVTALLAPVLWSASDLLTAKRRERMRQCANERCLWLFLDDSKSANRRWCSMSACGNRAKARRHYHKQKQAAEAGE